MKYEDNEILLTTVKIPIGNPLDENFIPIGTEVQFFKLVDNENDLTKTLVAFRYGSKMLVTLEANLKPKNKRKLKKAFSGFNSDMMRHHPELRRYHPNPFLKAYWRLYYYVKNLLGFEARAERKEKALLEKLKGKYE